MRFYNRQQAADRMGLSQQTIRNWEAAGLHMIGGIVREDELIAFAARMQRRRGRPRIVATALDNSTAVDVGVDRASLSEDMRPVVLTTIETLASMGWRPPGKKRL